MILSGQLPGISCGPEGTTFSRLAQESCWTSSSKPCDSVPAPVPALSQVRTPAKQGRGEAHTRTRTHARTRVEAVVTTGPECVTVKTLNAAVSTAESTAAPTVRKGEIGLKPTWGSGPL